MTKIQGRPEIILLLLCIAFIFVSPVLAQRVSSRRASETTSVPSRMAQPVVVGPNVQVSKAFANKPHNEIHLAANPRDPLNLIGGSMVWSEETNTHTVVAYASFDGGKSWSATLKFEDTLYRSDPAVGFDKDGTAYFLQITTTDEREPKLYTHVYRSKDGGRSWLEPTILPMLDRHYVVVDDNPGKYQGSLYINGTGGRGIRVQRSKDRGATFEKVIQAFAAAADRRIAGQGPAVVLSDGTLAMPFLDTPREVDPDREGSPTKPNSTLKVVTSADGGATFSEPVTVAQVAMGHALTSNAQHFSFAADSSAGLFKDRLYVTWTDSYSGGGQFSSKKSGGSNILLSYSADKGKTWSKPILISDDRLPFDLTKAPVHFQPVVAVNKDGVVGVMHYDRRNSANNLDWTVRFSASLDGGETFLPSVQVGTSPNKYGGGAKIIVSTRGYGGGHMHPNRNFNGGPLKFDVNISQFNLAGGHTAGLDADANGVFHPFWVDNRTGVAQIWTAPVTITKKPVNNGDPTLAMLEDVSERVTVKYTSPIYDATTGRLTVNIQMQNVSGDTILLPVKLRVVSFTCSAGGIPKIVGADNGGEGVGAVWDLDKVIIDQRLKPNQTTRPFQLQFHISDLPPLTEAVLQSRGWGALELLHIEARALANVQRNAPNTQK